MENRLKFIENSRSFCIFSTSGNFYIGDVWKEDMCITLLRDHLFPDEMAEILDFVNNH